MICTRRQVKICKYVGILLGILPVLFIARKISVWGAFSQQLAFFFVATYHIFLPLKIIEHEGGCPRDYGLHMYGLGRFIGLHRESVNVEALKLELKIIVKILMLIFVVYGFLFFAYRNIEAVFTHQTLDLRLSLRSEFVTFALSNLLLVALPEEIFYRSFIQFSLLQQVPNKLFIFGVPCGIVVTGASVIFALGHSLGDYQLLRLVTFFPGLLFCWLAFRSKSIFGAVIVHALCNVYADILNRSFILK